MSRNLTPILTGVLSAAASRLTVAERPAGLVHLAPGARVAYDNCCEGQGQLWLRVIDIAPSAGPGSPFPNYDSTQRGDCPALLSVQVGLGIVRCVHTLDDNGIPPTAEQMGSDGEEMLADSAILLDVLQCESRKILGVMTLKLGRWNPRGPEGGCAGGEWTAFLGVDPRIDCG